jgi:signal peptide peptidase SppA
MRPMRNYDHLLAFVLEHPWAITRPALQTIASVLSRRIAGHEASAEDLQAAAASRKNLPQPTNGAVAVIPVYGMLVPRASMFSDISGATSYEALTQQLREALANESITNIVLDVDSPGGNAAGATEFAQELMKARKKKPITAVANFTMCSAAYWLGACATEVVASPSARVGSVGVFTIHDDLSKALEIEGIKRTYISAGEFKTEGNPTEPLSPDALAQFKKMVDDVEATFHADLAKGRSVPIDTVRSKFGKGRTMNAEDAVAAGMVDRIATMDETLRRLTSGDKSTARASADTPNVSATSTHVPDRLWRAQVELALLETSL